MPLFLSLLPITYAFYCLAIVVYRLFFSPLAKFPGPKLAAITGWYEGYYDIFARGGEGGQFARQIEKLHQQYGPIVRVTPRELHINDPTFFSDPYGPSTRSKPMDKSDKFRYRFGIPNATFSTPAAEQHQERRAALNPFFSKQRIRGLHEGLTENVERISFRFATEYAGTGKVVNFNDVWSSMTMDTVTALAFGRSTTCSAAPDFEAPLAKGVQALAWYAHWNTHFQIFNDMMRLIPVPIMLKLMPHVKPIMEFQSCIREQVAAIVDGKDVKATEVSHPTIFHDIINSNLPASDKSVDRLTEEASSVVGAGTETTKWVLTVGTFHLLDNGPVLARLKAELAEAMPDSSKILPYSDLEKLPYLSAVIQESLRMSYGQVQGMPRINRLHPWKFNEWVIPPGVLVSMDAYSVHSNETVFPNARAFQPERWFNNPTGPGGRPLSHYLTSFGKGSRGCLGKELAYMELFVAIATLFRRFEMELYETVRDDADFVLDMVVPMPPRDSKGVRAIIKSVS
ncbi:cytochrome P450 [Zopfia rhizophila CBS 207.26]|uniref:Cytochrome P450 n=1 Tax=Zopfia rhizophila CBS 207.26 TaxID=1314779 RepID=A0A6A6EF42_9PEZI|nr:cytochrome P450 [Zopfia rhizophila CBS 207.26]